MPRWTPAKFNETVTLLRDGMSVNCETTELAIAAHKHLIRKGYVKDPWAGLANNRIVDIGEALADILADQTDCLARMNELLAMPDKEE